MFLFSYYVLTAMKPTKAMTSDAARDTLTTRMSSRSATHSQRSCKLDWLTKV